MHVVEAHRPSALCEQSHCEPSHRHDTGRKASHRQDPDDHPPVCERCDPDPAEGEQERRREPPKRNASGREPAAGEDPDGHSAESENTHRLRADGDHSPGGTAGSNVDQWKALPQSVPDDARMAVRVDGAVDGVGVGEVLLLEVVDLLEQVIAQLAAEVGGFALGAVGVDHDPIQIAFENLTHASAPFAFTFRLAAGGGSPPRTMPISWTSAAHCWALSASDRRPFGVRR